MDNTTFAVIQKAQELLKAGNKQEAQAILIPLVRENPEIAEAWYLLGFAVTEPEKRTHAFQQVLRIDPSNQPAQKQIAKLLEAQSVALATEKPVVTKKQHGSRLVWGLAGVVALLSVLVIVGGWWLSRNGLPVFEAPMPTAFSRHLTSTPQPMRDTVTPYPRSTSTPAPATTTPTATRISRADVGRIFASAVPAPTVNATSNPAIFTNKEIYWDYSTTTEIKYGHLNAGESVSVPLDIDSSSEAVFSLSWFGKGIPVFTLVSPDGQLIDEMYATNHPQDVTYRVVGTDTSFGSAAYVIKKPSTRSWELNLTASDPGDYEMYSLVGPNGLILSAASDVDSPKEGDIVTIGARLDDNSVALPGATVTAMVVLPNGAVETIKLTDLGNGLYAAAYRVPNVTGGYGNVIVTAKGSNHGVGFTRRTSLVQTFASNDLQLTGQYAESPRDEDGDGLYEKLDFNVGVNLKASGNYRVSADLYAGDQLVTYSVDFLDLAVGKQTITLSFEGVEIQQSRLDGPYTITNLSLTPIETGVESQHGDNVLTTAAYSHTQFGKVFYTISGNTGVPDAVLRYVDANSRTQTITADESGNYSFTVPYKWSATVTPYKMGYDFTPESITYTNLKMDQKNQDYKSAAIMYTISGKTQPGGVTLTYIPDGGTAKTIKSDSQGNYSLTLPFGWYGTITPSLAGHTFRPDHLSYNLLGNPVDQDYISVHTISGNFGLEGVRLTYDDDGPRVATSSPDGSYSLMVSDNWSGTVTPSLDGYTFTPASKTYANVTTNMTGEDYQAHPK